MNRMENDLFPETFSEAARELAPILRFPTYVFVIRITDDLVIGELSLPENYEGKHIVAWTQRLLIRLPKPSLDPEKGLESEDIDVPVRRKKSG